jgi:hypothetical protein
MSYKFKTSVYFPILLKKAIDRLTSEDIQGRRFNQFVIDTLLENKDIKRAMKEIKDSKQ